MADEEKKEAVAVEDLKLVEENLVAAFDDSLKLQLFELGYMKVQIVEDSKAKDISPDFIVSVVGELTSIGVINLTFKHSDGNERVVTVNGWKQDGEYGHMSRASTPGEFRKEIRSQLRLAQSVESEEDKAEELKHKVRSYLLNVAPLLVQEKGKSTELKELLLESSEFGNDKYVISTTRTKSKKGFVVGKYRIEVSGDTTNEDFPAVITIAEIV